VVTIAYMLSAVALLYRTLGSSQAMKAAWWEDLLGLLPPIAFLVSDRFRGRDPTPGFPYGYHRATSLAYLSASLALFTLGGFIRTTRRPSWRASSTRPSGWSSRSASGRCGWAG
jgi:divalent metal cation (Fe/Co/Zn/Cd) transporter